MDDCLQQLLRETDKFALDMSILKNGNLQAPDREKLIRFFKKGLMLDAFIVVAMNLTCHFSPRLKEKSIAQGERLNEMMVNYFAQLTKESERFLEIFNRLEEPYLSGSEVNSLVNQLCKLNDQKQIMVIDWFSNMKKIVPKYYRGVHKAIDQLLEHLGVPSPSKKKFGQSFKRPWVGPRRIRPPGGEAVYG